MDVIIHHDEHPPPHVYNTMCSEGFQSLFIELYVLSLGMMIEGQTFHRTLEIV